MDVRCFLMKTVTLLTLLAVMITTRREAESRTFTVDGVISSDMDRYPWIFSSSISLVTKFWMNSIQTSTWLLTEVEIFHLICSEDGNNRVILPTYPRRIAKVHSRAEQDIISGQTEDCLMVLTSG